MKVLKIIAISIGGLILLLAIGGYIFFKKVFTPAPNYLQLTESSGFIPIQWIKSEHSDIAALLLPVHLPGIDRTFYFQFDTGTPSTLIYQQALTYIPEEYPNEIGDLDSPEKTVDLTFRLGDMNVHSNQFKLYDFGISIGTTAPRFDWVHWVRI